MKKESGMQLSKIDANSSCQPLKQSVAAVPLREVSFKNSAPSIDSFKNSNKAEAKYDFACRLIAFFQDKFVASEVKANFYKEKYESLLAKQTCYA